MVAAALSKHQIGEVRGLLKRCPLSVEELLKGSVSRKLLGIALAGALVPVVTTTPDAAVFVTTAIRLAASSLSSSASADAATAATSAPLDTMAIAVDALNVLHRLVQLPDYPLYSAIALVPLVVEVCERNFVAPSPDERTITLGIELFEATLQWGGNELPPDAVEQLAGTYATFPKLLFLLARAGTDADAAEEENAKSRKPLADAKKEEFGHRLASILWQCFAKNHPSAGSEKMSGILPTLGKLAPTPSDESPAAPSPIACLGENTVKLLRATIYYAELTNDDSGPMAVTERLRAVFAAY